MARVDIRDSKNIDRLLGSIERPSGASPRLDGGDCYNMAVIPRMTPFRYDQPFFPETSATIVRFGFRAYDWQIVMITDAPLDVLSKLEGFRFPGESARAAEYRGYHY